MGRVESVSPLSNRQALFGALAGLAVVSARALTRPASVDDRPIVSFLAHRRVVGQLVDLARLRWETGSLTDGKAIWELQPATAVVVSRALRERPVILRYVRAHYRRVYARGGVDIYRR